MTLSQHSEVFHFENINHKNPKFNGYLLSHKTKKINESVSHIENKRIKNISFFLRTFAPVLLVANY